MMGCHIWVIYLKNQNYRIRELQQQPTKPVTEQFNKNESPYLLNQ